MILTKRRAAFCLALSGSLFLTGCFNGSSGSSDPTPDPEQPSTQLPDTQTPGDSSEIAKEITATIQDLENRGELPILDTSDSLEGPDTDFNGVRDDIQNWLDNQTLSPNVRENLQELARGYQRIMTISDLSSSITHEIANDMAPIAACLSLTADDSDRIDGLQTELSAFTTNTEERLQRFWDYQDTLFDLATPVPSRSECSQILSSTSSSAYTAPLPKEAKGQSTVGLCGAATEKNNKLAVAFFNGVGNTYTDAFKAITYVKDVLELSGELEDSPFTDIAFRPLYNPTQKAFGISSVADLKEVFYQRMKESSHEMSEYDAEVLKATFEERAEFLALFMQARYLKAEAGLGKVYTKEGAERLRKEAAALMNEPSAYETTEIERSLQEVYQEHQSVVNGWAEEGRKMFYVAHSQGNLFANEALRYAVSGASQERKNLKLLHVAPASQTLEGGRYVLNSLDIIIRPLLNTPEPTVENNLADQLTIDASGHKFRETYLSEFPSGLQTITFMVEMFGELEDLAVSENDKTSPDTSEYFTITASWDGGEEFEKDPAIYLEEKWWVAHPTTGYYEEGESRVNQSTPGIFGEVTEITEDSMTYTAKCGLPSEAFGEDLYGKVTIQANLLTYTTSGFERELRLGVGDSFTISVEASDGTVIDSLYHRIEGPYESHTLGRYAGFAVGNFNSISDSETEITFTNGGYGEGEEMGSATFVVNKSL
jgi:hypothetical protein